MLFNIPMFLYKKHSQPKIVLILTPQYLNWGDQAIALSEIKIIKERYPDIELLEINMSFYKLWSKCVQKIINADDFIIITGGGYMGDLWEGGQSITEHIIKAYPRNAIMLAPQTIYFQDLTNARQFKDLISKRKNIYILAREEKTYQLLTNEMKLEANTICNVVPDLALFLAENLHDKRRKNACLCFRSDHEKIISSPDINKIKQLLKNNGTTYTKMKMFYPHVEIPIWLRSICVKWKLKQYLNKKVMVTDRLHCMIFSAITATPCVAFDNISGKISGVYEKWMKDLPYITVIRNVFEFEGALKKVTAYYNRNELLTVWQEKLKRENMELIWKELDKWSQKR